MTEQVAPLCVECKHYWVEFSTSSSYSPTTVLAERCHVKVQSHVHGAWGDPKCEWSRAFEYLCGPSGKWWEKR